MGSAEKPLSNTARTKVHRVPHKEVLDRNALYALMDAALIGHVGIVEIGRAHV